MSDEYYIEYSAGKLGWSVYKRDGSARGPVQAGPFSHKPDAEKERDWLNSDRSD